MKERSPYQHRMSTARIRVTDPAGNPLKQQKIRFRLVNHEFLFGCGAFDVMPLVNEKPYPGIGLDQDSVKAEKAFFRDRVDKWLSAFNYGTIPFYWGRYEPVEGHPEQESRMNTAAFLNEHGVKVKGHPLCWHTVCADWLMKYDNKTILEKQLARIRRDVSAFRGVVDIWDVINEVVIMPIFDKYDNAVTRICRDLGRVGLVKEVFAAARDANPDATLLINDFNLSDSYQILIDGCLNAGVSIDAIGLQTHQHQGYKGKAWLEEVLERFSVFGLPLHFTENTLVSGHLMPPEIVDLNDYQVDEWPSTPEGEERQEKEWKEMYEFLFAHPLVEAITGWDFADGAWLHAPSGLIRQDNTEKPAFRTLKRLIHEEWTTDETVTTDADGYAEICGFRGEYQAEGSTGKARFRLKKENKEQDITLA